MTLKVVHIPEFNSGSYLQGHFDSMEKSLSSETCCLDFSVALLFRNDIISSELHTSNNLEPTKARRNHEQQITIHNPQPR